MLHHPIICLVTDRRRLQQPHEDSLVRLVRAASRAGVNLIHVRERDLDARRLSVLVHRIVEAAGGSTVVVNDRADVARAAGAHGVHLRADSPAADRVRAIVPEGFVIGRSVHSVREAAAAEHAGGIDYLVMGTIYASAGKPASAPLTAVEALAEASRSVRLPVVAIGGIRQDNLMELGRTGAAGIAAVGLFAEAMTGRQDASAEAALVDVVEAVHRAFAPGDGDA